MPKYQSKIPALVEAFTFAEFIAYGLERPGANIVNGMPWSFDFYGYPVTHESDEMYLINLSNGDSWFITPKVVLMAYGEKDVALQARADFEQHFERAHD